jgi:phage-related protein
MATPTFAPAVAPSSPVDIAVQPRVLVARFGDGYEQRTGDGLNSLVENVTLRWDHIRATEADPIINFFEARGGIESFFYTLPGGSVPKKYRCVSWQRTRMEANLDSVIARLVQSFDLGA